MQPDSDLPPRPTEPDFLEDMAALTGLFNPEIIWEKEATLDNLDEQDAARANEPAAPSPPAGGQPEPAPWLPRVSHRNQLRRHAHRDFFGQAAAYRHAHRPAQFAQIAALGGQHPAQLGYFGGAAQHAEVAVLVA